MLRWFRDLSLLERDEEQKRLLHESFSLAFLGEGWFLTGQLYFLEVAQITISLENQGQVSVSGAVSELSQKNTCQAERWHSQDQLLQSSL